MKQYGGLDVAVNNAGILPPTAPLAEQSEEDWNSIISVDVTGVFLGLKYELAEMAKSGTGAIINTASVAGLRADPGMAPYVAAKHAVVGLTKAAAIDYAHTQIRVNAIAPGLVRTPMTERWLEDPEMRELVLADSPIRRAAAPEEIAGTVLFLASDMASAITGAIYPVDGLLTDARPRQDLHQVDRHPNLTSGSPVETRQDRFRNAFAGLLGKRASNSNLTALAVHGAPDGRSVGPTPGDAPGSAL